MRSTSLLCLAVLLVILPVASRAQEPAGGPTSPPPVVRAPEEDPIPGRSARLLPPAEPGYARPSRIAAGTLVGTLGAALGGVVGLVGGGALSSCIFDGCSPQRAPIPYVGFMLGSALAGSATYYGIGAVIHGRGEFLPTLLGAVAPQLLLGVPVFAGLFNEGYLLLSPLLAAVGAAIGYELSHGSSAAPLAPSEPDPFARRTGSPGVHVVPVLGATSGGGLLGLAGTF